jgi:hypothetical protein
MRWTGRSILPVLFPSAIGGGPEFAMIEILYIYQMARNPVQVFARRWWCRSLFRATRGKRGCPERTNS